MDPELLDILADPESGLPLALDGDALRSPSGASFPVRNEIPRFVTPDDSDQAATAQTFDYKWRRRDSYGSEGMVATLRDWMTRRYGFERPEELGAFFGGRGWVLDVGCGSGMNATYWLDYADPPPKWVGADISEAIDVAYERLGARANTHFVQADVTRLPFRDRVFDVIIAEGILHHTPSTEQSFRALVPLLRPGGSLLVYVYRKKAPVREFTDDYVRDAIAHMTPEEGWEALRPLTLLGKQLAELRAEVDVLEDVPLLGIEAGRHDVQRLLYWHFAKLFWNDAMGFEESHHVNFDWYHPRYAHRHTREELTRWCADSGLEIDRLHEEESGFTLHARKP